MTSMITFPVELKIDPAAWDPVLRIWSFGSHLHPRRLIAGLLLIHDGSVAREKAAKTPALAKQCRTNPPHPPLLFIFNPLLQSVCHSRSLLRFRLSPPPTDSLLLFAYFTHKRGFFRVLQGFCGQFDGIRTFYHMHDS